jgi:hypothetical protein
MQCEDLADLALNRMQRVERCHRLLEDHGDVIAAHPAQVVLVVVQKVFALEHHGAGRVMAAG